MSALAELGQVDHCIGFFSEMYESGRVPIPEGAKVLEIGCAEVDWLTPMKALRPDLHLTGLDQRTHPPRPGADELVRGNLLNGSLFPYGSFDVIVAISVLEHVGIGRYGDERHPDGDMIAMRHLKTWLKPDGFLYLDVPYRPDGPSTDFRAYSPEDLEWRLIQDWKVVQRQFFDYRKHPDGPYIALVLKP